MENITSRSEKESILVLVIEIQDFTISAIDGRLTSPFKFTI